MYKFWTANGHPRSQCLSLPGRERPLERGCSQEAYPIFFFNKRLTLQVNQILLTFFQCLVFQLLCWFQLIFVDCLGATVSRSCFGLDDDLCLKCNKRARIKLFVNSFVNSELRCANHSFVDDLSCFSSKTKLRNSNFEAS